MVLQALIQHLERNQQQITEDYKMKEAKMPSAHSEKIQPKSPVGGLKYTSGSNPEALDKASKGLADYAKKHKASH
jgi:hypothetical protein